jgi:hypothetical protein
MAASVAPKKDLVIVRQDATKNGKVDGLNAKKMLKIYENLNKYQCFSEFIIRDGKMKIVIRPPEDAFVTVKEFLSAVELQYALNSVAYLSISGQYMLRIKITASIYEKADVSAQFTYNIRMLNTHDFECDTSKEMASDKFLSAKVKKIQKLVIIGGDHGLYPETVFKSK